MLLLIMRRQGSCGCAWSAAAIPLCLAGWMKCYTMVAGLTYDALKGGAPEEEVVVFDVRHTIPFFGVSSGGRGCCVTDSGCSRPLRRLRSSLDFRLRGQNNCSPVFRSASMTAVCLRKRAYICPGRGDAAWFWVPPISTRRARGRANESGRENHYIHCQCKEYVFVLATNRFRQSSERFLLWWLLYL